MHSMTVVLLLCLVAAAVARTQYVHYPEGAAIPTDELSPESEYYPEHESTLRSKRSLLLLKKKLLLGAVGLKAAKIGALGVGALALKKKSVPHPPVRVINSYGY